MTTSINLKHVAKRAAVGLLVLALTSVVPPSRAAAMPTLIGFSFDNGAISDTAQGGFCDIYVSATGGTGALINVGTDLMNVPLPVGSHTFDLFVASPSATAPIPYLNIFLNGNRSTPAISVIAPAQTSALTVPAFSAYSGPSWDLPPPGVDRNSSTPGAGTLSFFDAGSQLRVTLTSYRMAIPSVDNLDRMSSNCLSPFPDGVPDTHIELTLVVEPALVPFAAFAPKVEIAADEFEVKAPFTLGAGSNGIDPVTEIVKLELTGGTGSFSTTIPAGSFTLDNEGRFKFEGVINGVTLEAVIQPLGGGSFEFKAEGQGANLAGLANPVTVKLTIGDDGGTTTVQAEFE